MNTFSFVKTAVRLVNKDNRKNLLFKAWEDCLVSTIEMSRLLWEFQISSKDFPGFNLKLVCSRKTIEQIANDFEVKFNRANLLAYAATRSYIKEDDMIEIMHGMHKDILKGELDSHVLS